MVKAAPPRLKTSASRKVSGGVARSEKRADPFYSTREYRDWRALVIALAGGQCQDPAHDPAKPREDGRLFADHIQELRDGGAPLDPLNGMARCGACHTRKTLAERARRMWG